MVKQYVGARYVPKFATPVEWAADTSYEALTIVTFNNASYTSKVPVPPTVGNPANNPQYWALTGNYNAQVEQYRQETENYNAQVEEYREETSKLNNIIDQTVKHFNTVNDLITDNNLKVGDYVLTGGYYNINDGGSALYKIEQTSEETGSNILKCHNNLQARYIINGPIDIRQLGAIAGNDNDNYDANNNAINDALKLHEKVFIPRGTFNIDKTINIPSGCYMFGTGHAYSDSVIYMVGASTADIMLKCTDNCSGNYISDILFNCGNNATYVYYENSENVTKYADSNVMKNVALYGNKATYIIFDSNEVGSNYTSVFTEGGTYGFYIDSTDNTLLNCTANHAKKYGISCHKSNNHLINCSASDCGTYEATWEKTNAGIYVKGIGNTLLSCKTQQNPNCGIIIDGISFSTIQFVSDGDGSETWNTAYTAALVMLGTNISSEINVICNGFGLKRYNVIDCYNVQGNNINCNITALFSVNDGTVPNGKHITRTDEANSTNNNISNNLANTLFVSGDASTVTLNLSQMHNNSIFKLDYCGTNASGTFYGSFASNGTFKYGNTGSGFVSASLDTNTYVLTLTFSENSYVKGMVVWNGLCGYITT